MVLLIIRLMLAASLLLSLYIMSVTLERCRSEKRYGFFYCCVAIFLYTLGYFIEITCGIPGGAIIAVKIMYAGGSFMAPLFFFFSADYCEIHLPKKFYHLPMMIIPVLFYLVVLTFWVNPAYIQRPCSAHRQFYKWKHGQENLILKKRNLPE